MKVAYKEYFTMDDYSTELDVENGVETDEDDVWEGEDHVELPGIPKELWSDHTVDSTPDSPEPWVDELADRIEVQRLVTMNLWFLLVNFMVRLLANSPHVLFMTGVSKTM